MLPAQPGHQSAQKPRKRLWAGRNDHFQLPRPNCLSTESAGNRRASLKADGQTTIIKEQVTRSGRGLGSQVSTTMHEVQRPLLTPDECLRMPGPQKNDSDLITRAGDMVVYCGGFRAIYGRQPVYFEDQTFAARAKIPPPKHNHALDAVRVHDVQIA